MNPDRQLLVWFTCFLSFLLTTQNGLTLAFSVQPPSVRVTDSTRLQVYTEGDSDESYYNSESTTPSESPPARRRRGPIRSSRLTVSAQDQVDKQRAAQTRQRVAHQDPTLLATATATNSSSSIQNATSFAQANLATPTLRALMQLIGNETQMTQVQAMTFGPARQGMSLRVRSKTGSGKTLAFVVPLLERVLEETPIQTSGGSTNSIRLLIVAPTRELAQQIGSTVQDLLAFYPPNEASNFLQVVYGGTNIVAQVRQMERHGVPNILIATPGRLVELLDRKVRGRLFKKYLQLSQQVTTVTSTNRNNYMMVVLDEADHVMSNFGPEMRTIVQALPRKRQTLLFSATLMTEQNQSPRRPRKTSSRAPALSPEAIMGEPIVGIQDIDCVALRSAGTNVPGTPKANAAVNVNVQEYALTLPSMQDYFPTLQSLLRQELQTQEQPKIVVFFPATKLVQFMAQLLLDHDDSLSSLLHIIHSRMSQAARQKASQAFFDKSSAILFTSDVSARGMDYPNVTTVIQYGLPNRRELYLHRLGRTARAGYSGKGILVALPFERLSSLRLRRNALASWEGATDTTPGGPATRVQSAKLVASAESAYKAFVAYYVGNRHDKQTVLDAAQELAQSVGLTNLPELPEKLL
mmetsp:Transcript_38147/g.79322  ORF Transcript_38147/g.79322 Transcript_38147/m.79322 type:complete len:636 (-) Transcript_38147:173-2080(-)